MYLLLAALLKPTNVKLWKNTYNPAFLCSFSPRYVAGAMVCVMILLNSAKIITFIYFIFLRKRGKKLEGAKVML